MMHNQIKASNQFYGWRPTTLSDEERVVLSKTYVILCETETVGFLVSLVLCGLYHMVLFHVTHANKK